MAEPTGGRGRRLHGEDETERAGNEIFANKLTFYVRRGILILLNEASGAMRYYAGKVI